MKLFYCPDCHDIVKLTKDNRTCECGKCSGQYTDDVNATIVNGIPLGFANTGFRRAVDKHNQESIWGHEFVAFVIPPNTDSVLRVKE